MHSINQIPNSSSTSFSTKTKKNYFALNNKIKQIADNPTQFAILMHMVDFINSPLGFFERQDTLGEKIGVSRWTIMREMKKLFEKKCIVLLKRDGRSLKLRLSDELLAEFHSDNVVSIRNNRCDNMPQEKLQVATSVVANCNTNVLKIINKSNDDDRACAREESSPPPEIEKLDPPDNSRQIPKITKEQVLLVERIRRRLPQKDFEKIPLFPNEWIVNSTLKIELIESVLEFIEKNNETFHDSVLNSQTHFEDLIKRINDRQNNVKPVRCEFKIDSVISTHQIEEKIQPEANGDVKVPQWLFDFNRRAKI